MDNLINAINKLGDVIPGTAFVHNCVNAALKEPKSFQEKSPVTDTLKLKRKFTIPVNWPLLSTP